ncbi:hypothetical protein N657DRAFT_648950 [Parathielavia appendiculata]|uniref:Heterokaryon incompatibility domain-containing protein n=1 Tax=Parathielavia appendiculata TaxID=2587402 RepID=A0AAN6Z0H3_9PEZI|nr:hypothetical protein N657DRAFT_648950 [Parathielavia appendiculata]
MSDNSTFASSVTALEGLNIREAEPESRKPYRYQPLPTLTSIRVLKLRGRDEDGTPQVTLDVVDLDHDPFFYALSYTWGNPHASGVDFTAHFNAVNAEYSVAQTTAVLCDGKLLRVQRNLLDVLGELQQLQTAARGHDQVEHAASETNSPINIADGELVIWIDAICINQNDMEERALQVRIMDKVYSKAAYTIIWLGRSDEYTAAAVQTIRRVSAYPRNVFAQSEVIPFRGQDPDVYAKSNLQYTDWMDWCSLAALLKRQWFSRLWIIQETILSRNLVLLCGKHLFSWTTLVKAARNIDARCRVLGWSPSTVFIDIHEIAVPLENNVLSLAEWRDHLQTTNTQEPSDALRFTLEELVYATWVFKSTDPRDKIYGILGLVDDQVRAAWDIDYHSPPIQVFAAATRRLIEHSGSLKIFSCVQDASKRTIDTYPSWVPDYSLPYFNMMCNGGSFAAAGKLTHQPPQLVPSSPSWSRLRVRGHIFDTIVETGNDRTDHVNSAVLLDPSWFELALLLKTPYPGTTPKQRRTEVLWRTLCADQDATSTVSPAPARFGALFKEFVCAMVVVRAELEAEEVAAYPDSAAPDCATSFAHAMRRAKDIWAEVGWDRRGPEYIRDKTNSKRFLARPEFGWLVHTLIKLQALALTEEGGEEADTPSWEELERFVEKPSWVMRVKRGEERKLVQPNDAAFMNSFKRRYVKRKLFYTRKGYLGLGPASAAVGDIVCILPGAVAPFVCREDHDGGVELEDCSSATMDLEVQEERPVERLRLVGECYVHGIMQGEALDLEDFGLKDIEFV